MSEKVIVTQEILDLNPDLVEQGVQIGEEIELGELCDENGDPLTSEKTASKDDEPEANDTNIVGGREKDDR
jgi:hypothetical protein